MTTISAAYPSELERRAAYDVTEVKPIGGRLVVVTPGSAYTVISSKDFKTVLLGPSATLAQLRTYCQTYDPLMATFPATWDAGVEDAAAPAETPSQDREEPRAEHKPTHEAPRGRHPGRRR